jgi:hypothetical protein
MESDNRPVRVTGNRLVDINSCVGKMKSCDRFLLTSRPIAVEFSRP